MITDQRKLWDGRKRQRFRITVNIGLVRPGAVFRSTAGVSETEIMPWRWQGRRQGKDRKTSSRLLLRADQLAVDQAFGDLNRVQSRALAEVVGYTPQHQPVFDRGILADAADIGRILADAFVRGDVAAGLVAVDDQAARRSAQDGARL